MVADGQNWWQCSIWVINNLLNSIQNKINKWTFCCKFRDINGKVIEFKDVNGKVIEFRYEKLDDL